MRIALFHNLPSGGAKRAVYEWTKGLCVEHDIDVYTLNSADHDFCDIRPFVKKYGIFEFSPHALLNRPFGRLNQLQRWRDLRDLMRLDETIAQEIDAANYDIVFVNTCRYTFIPGVALFLHTPSLYYLHEPFGSTFVRQFQRPYIKDSYWRTLVDRHDPLIELYQNRLAMVQQESLHHTTRLLANSRFTQEQIRLAFKVDAIVCHCGVNPLDFYPVIGIHKKNNVLSVGELSPRKGFDFLIESLAYVPPAQRPQLRLACNTVLPQEKNYIETLAAQHKVKLHILINLNVEQLRREYNEAMICVYAPVAEPFGLVPLEAMACGTPVVGVREGGVQESIVDGYTGLLTERDPRQFGLAVQHLLTRPALVAEYGRNARTYVLENWTWEQSVAQLEWHLRLQDSQKP